MIKLELRDRNFNTLEDLTREELDLSWSYSRIGGCGEFQFVLPRKLFEEKSISGDFNIRIYYRESDGSFTLRYQGLVEDKYPSVQGDKESISISGHGYQSQLSRIYIDQTFTNTEISAIAAAIIGTSVSASTNIVFDASLIATTSFTPDSIDFNDDALSCIKKLAEIAGNIEWGVDRNRKFFFKQKSTSVGFYFPLGRNITSFNEDIDFKDIVNRIIVQGAQAGGTYYMNTYNSLKSQLKYNLRTQLISNSSINTDAVASQFSASQFIELNVPQRNASCDLINYSGWLEGTTPIPLVNIISKSVTFGTKKFGTFLFSGAINRQINRINYSFKSRSGIRINLEMGKSRPVLSEQFARIQYDLDQQRSAAL